MPLSPAVLLTTMMRCRYNETSGTLLEVEFHNPNITAWELQLSDAYSSDTRVIARFFYGCSLLGLSSATHGPLVPMFAHPLFLFHKPYTSLVRMFLRVRAGGRVCVHAWTYMRVCMSKLGHAGLSADLSGSFLQSLPTILGCGDPGPSRRAKKGGGSGGSGDDAGGSTAIVFEADPNDKRNQWCMHTVSSLTHAHRHRYTHVTTQRTCVHCEKVPILEGL